MRGAHWRRLVNTVRRRCGLVSTCCVVVGVQGVNGKQMYSGCNLLRADFSKLSELSVRYNNDKTRDFTNALLPSSDAVQPAAVPATAPLDDPQRAAATHPGTGGVMICDFVLTSSALSMPPHTQVPAMS